MKKILIGGCSFSQTQGNNTKKKWTPWSDFIDKDNFFIKNVALSSYGQLKISETIITEIINSNFSFDFVFIQWSAFGRGVSRTETEFFKWVTQTGQEFMLPYSNEYVNTGLQSTAITNKLTAVDSLFYTASLIQIELVKTFLEHHNIKYLMFWGWEQITDNIYFKNKKIIDSIYKGSWWTFNKYGGVLEYGVDLLGNDKAIIKQDFHPTTEVHELFYENIILPVLNEL
jgi:hypothetical protein